MLNKLIMFFTEIKKKDNWKERWIKKLSYDKNKSVVEIYERKFAKSEIKEICRNSKNKVSSIKEYRYDDEGFLKKVVIKDGDGTIKYINDIQYDDEYNIKSILAVSKNNQVELSKLSLIDKSNNVVQEEFNFIDVESKVISKREIEYKENRDIIHNIWGQVLKESCTFDMDNNLLIMDYYDDDDNHIGDIVYGFKDILIFVLNHRILNDLENEKEFTVSFKELMEEEGFLGMVCKKLMDGELNDVIVQCFCKDKGPIQKVNFLKGGKIIYFNEYIYE